MEKRKKHGIGLAHFEIKCRVLANIFYQVFFENDICHQFVPAGGSYFSLR